jgi:hypothetical protein
VRGAGRLRLSPVRDWWHLPGPARLVQEMTDSLDATRSILLLRPAAQSLDGLESLLVDRVDRRWQHVDLSEIAAGRGTLLQRLHDHLGLTGSAIDASLAKLVDAPQLTRAAIWIEGTSAVDARQLAALVAGFARVAAVRAPEERPVLVVCAAPAHLDPVPIGETALARLWWWGRVGPLDTRVVADAAMGPSRVLGDVDVVAEIAKFDLSLADELARGYSGSVAEDLEALIPRDRYSDGAAIEAARQTGWAPLDEPPSLVLEAWSAGHVDWWGDQVVVHVGCLLHREPQELERLVWRGQVIAVMPFIEHHRQRLARWVDARRSQLDDGWRERDLLEMEAGPLHHLFLKHPTLRRTRAAWQAAETLKTARHSLAHLRPLPRDWLAQQVPQLRAASLD